ncbi:SMP-30/gluconolactonase/LRE family protein [Nocardia cyriacigeorgica]|uniref:SMP-30/gluconolactonase/LRE family protein n=1 Tax=Nocardia cyriacigeorgica TaxID=135487 RepID=UPI001894C5B7|nr:SMP-30/gluconolactonase/LRE family protein [Nocardia cyriacigeorgica]MBF6452012.1 SMP-30/gluconolactonase/LRE family protein [Nocardia cyriacigeorgica]MBF6478376.1 SMP-30/gluconolactonase/LRE family protein [Nocardia cyriacigeorgica]MBF6549181.1 SMP-30/gluconolactonase/LRE family protein [Nocardia cyriacigeorgica]
MAFGMARARAWAALLAVTVAAGLATAGPAHAQPFPAMCGDGWEATTVVEGVGNLENLDSDGAGGFYVTGIVDGFLAHVSADGKFEKLITGLDKPAGVRVVGRSVYFLTGDGINAAPGTLQRYDIDTGASTVLLTGLNGPNGLLLLPDGDLLFSTLGMQRAPTGIARYRPSTGEYTETWSSLPLTNGLALAADGRSIYTDNLTMRIFRIPLDAPNSPTVVAGPPELFALPDDMEATRDGDLFVADHIAGAIYRVDTATGASCAIISGLIKRPDPVRIPPDGTTSVRIARDGDSWSLFITGMDGTLRRLRPPAGIDLTPADATRR